MEPAAIASVIVSLIAALAGFASQRSAAKAQTRTAATSSRAELEKEAYERARAFDTETIKRQDDELSELRQHVKDLNSDVKRMASENETLHRENVTVLEDNHRLRAEVRSLRLRFTRIERKYPTDDIPIQSIRERETDTDPMLMREILDGREREH